MNKGSLTKKFQSYFRKEEAIFICINTALKKCAGSSDETTARGMLEETTATVRDMCTMREMSGRYKLMAFNSVS